MSQPLPSPSAALAGVVSAKPGGAARVGQQQMADAVADALATGATLLVEAPTGVGKSFGYLVPALLRAVADRNGDGSSSAIVISTATKALQEQLVGVDLPFLVEALEHQGVRFDYAMLMGRSNYVCRAQLAALLPETETVLRDVVSGQLLLDAPAVGRVRDWVETTETGERGEISVSDEAWRQLSVTSAECPGRNACPFSVDCFAYQARDRAESADVIVANTALYGAHLASDGAVLPEHQAVIFDEAHTLEDVMADALSVVVGPARIRSVAYKVRSVLRNDELTRKLLDLSGDLGFLIEDRVGMKIDATSGELEQQLLRVSGLVSEVAAACASTPETATRSVQAKRAQLGQQASGLAVDVDRLRVKTLEAVTWVEQASGGNRIKQAPVNIGPLLAEKLFDVLPVIATSATLSVGGSFAARRHRWGLTPDRSRRVEELSVESPFDFPRQGYLYVAAQLPDPRSESYPAAARRELSELALAANGHTLALFTSRTAMVAAVEYLRGETTLKVLMQGEASRADLLDEFTSGPNHILCALASFWTGLDIPGSALSLVVIDKIPFPRRGDPLIDARRLDVGRRGGNGFADIDLAAAATDLAQGTGRLIRSGTDKGVVAILDSRLRTKSYAKTLLDSLPDLYRTTDATLVRTALQRLTADL